MYVYVEGWEVCVYKVSIHCTFWYLKEIDTDTKQQSNIKK